MKSLTKHLVLLCLTLYSSSLFSQGHYTLTPGNTDIIAQDIFLNYTAGINISLGDIVNHLEQISLPSTYSESCKGPLLQFDGQTGQELDFSWAAIAGNTSYRLTFLNLSNGDMKEFNTTATHITIPDLEDAMYTVSLVAFCGEGEPFKSSAADIIIIEKPVMFINNPLTDCPCQKIAVDFAVDRTTYTGSSGVDISWTPTHPTQYFLKISYGGIAGSSLRFATELNPGGSPPYKLRMFCVGYLGYGYSLAANTFFGPGLGSNDLSLHFSPANYELNLNDPFELVETITMYRCRDREGNGDDHTTKRFRQNNDLSDSYNVFPNPSSEFITIQNLAKGLNNVEINIYNDMGQLMQFNKQKAFSSFAEIDISQWPSGRYTVMINDGKNVQNKSFVKI